MSDRFVFDQLSPSARKPLESFTGLTPVQRQTIPEVLSGRSCLVIAPTASGKTEAALVPLVHLSEQRDWRGEPRILWIAPTRALVNDLQRRLSLALQGHLSVGRRTADKHDFGVDILVTTPESLDSMLVRGCCSDAKHQLSGVRAIVLDELHLLADGQRGTQLNVLLARLERLTGPLTAVGLSATVSDAPQLASRFLGSGSAVITTGSGRGLFVHHRATGLPDQATGQVDPLAYEIWPVDRKAAATDITDRLLDLRRLGRLKALLFVSSRSRCDKVSGDLVRLLGTQSPVQVVAHHGSLSKEERERAERILNDADESVAVATATLEIGIDVGDITSVILDGPPSSVSSLLQRVGRANRRGGGDDETHVLPLAANAIEACIFASMLRAARGGRLDPSQPVRHYSVAIQQAASVLRQSRNRRVPRRMLLADLAREFGSMAAALVEGLEAGGWLERRDQGLVAPGERLGELMDSDRRLHANIGDAAGLIPVVDDVTGDPIAWVPRQAVNHPIQLAGRIFDAERTPEAIRVRERSRPAKADALRYATRRAPVMRSALRHLALGLGLQEAALVHGPTGWVHFGGALYAGMLRLLGVAGGALSSETDPRRVSLGTLQDACRRNWEGLETFFGFGPFQRCLPQDLRRAAVMDSLPVETFTTWLETLEEVSLSAEQERVLYGT